MLIPPPIFLPDPTLSVMPIFENARKDIVDPRLEQSNKDTLPTTDREKLLRDKVDAITTY
jgi:hypothetical protein